MKVPIDGSDLNACLERIEVAERDARRFGSSVKPL